MTNRYYARRIGTFALGVAAVAGASVLPAEASPAPRGAASSTSIASPPVGSLGPAAGRRISRPMRVGGFDAAVARAHGVIQPRNVLGGTCGTSYIYIYNGNADPYTGVNYGGRGYGYNTGFSVRAPVVGFYWQVVVTGPSWDKVDHDNGHNLYGGRTWVGHNHWKTTSPGLYVAAVDFYSTATLSDGTICYTNGPSDNVDVT